MAAGLLVPALAVAGGAGVAIGGHRGEALIFVAAAPLLVLAIQALGYRSILVWLALEGIATPFLRWPSHHALVSFDRVWIPLMALAAARSTPGRRAPTRWMSGSVAVIVVWIGIRAALTSSSQTYAVGVWVDAFALPAMLVYTVRRFAQDALRTDRIAGWFGVAGAVLGLIAVLERIVGFQLATRSGGAVFIDPSVGVRYSGPYGQPDMLAVALLICLAMTFMWLQGDLRRRAVLGALVISLELTGIWLTYFRGAWIAALVVVVLSVGLRPGRYARLFGFAALVGAIAAVAFVQIGDSQSALSARLGQTQNLTGRLATYRDGISLAAKHPLLGVGVAQYSAVASQQANTVVVAGTAAAIYPHNMYLDVLVEDGVFGFIALVAVSGGIWQLARRLRRAAVTRQDVLLVAAFTAAALSYLILGMEETVILQAPPNLLLAVVVGLGAARLDAKARARAGLTASQSDDTFDLS